MTITHAMELEALAGRYAEAIDPHGDTLAIGVLVPTGGTGWKLAVRNAAGFPFDLSDIADIAGTVIELRGGR